jgi:catechol 2,3-dioxygenase-like lactoylglutathione lyase family enzyme
MPAKSAKSAGPLSMRTVLNVADFDTTVQFYTAVLGFPVVDGWDRGPADRGAIVEVVPGGRVEIVGHGPGFAVPRYHDDALAVQLADRGEVDAWHARLTAAGVTAGPPVVQSWGHYSMSLRDPVDLEIVLYADER